MKRLFNRIVPDEALEGIGFVAYRIDDGWIAPGTLVASGGTCVPMSPAALRRLRWRPWPSMRDHLPTFSAPRGGIHFTR